VREQLYRRMLSRASDLLGDQEALAHHLGVTSTRLMLWSVGAESIPAAVFLRLVDLLLRGSAGATAADGRSPTPGAARTGQMKSADRTEHP